MNFETATNENMNKNIANKKVTESCIKLLANQIMESFEVTLEEV